LAELQVALPMNQTMLIFLIFQIVLMNMFFTGAETLRPEHGLVGQFLQMWATSTLQEDKSIFFIMRVLVAHLGIITLLA
jgi:hypothetical protein